MNEETFLQFVEKNSNCEPELLNIAVRKGIQRAKNDRLDIKKIFMLAAASVFTFVMCIILNLTAVKTFAEDYYRNWHKNMPSSAEILDGYIIGISANIKRNFGGE